MRSICIYCGSNTGSNPIYAERAAALGTRLAQQGLAVVYGGGNVGLMGVVADAALAAGGEVDEMFEMLTWRQLGIGDKPCAFLDVQGFFEPLVAMMDRMVEERFLHADQRRDLWHGDDLDAMLHWMQQYRPVQADKWLDDKRRKQLR